MITGAIRHARPLRSSVASSRSSERQPDRIAVASDRSRLGVRGRSDRPRSRLLLGQVDDLLEHRDLDMPSEVDVARPIGGIRSTRAKGLQLGERERRSVSHPVIDTPSIDLGRPAVGELAMRRARSSAVRSRARRRRRRARRRWSESRSSFDVIGAQSRRPRRYDGEPCARAAGRPRWPMTIGPRPDPSPARRVARSTERAASGPIAEQGAGRTTSRRRNARIAGLAGPWLRLVAHTDPGPA